MTLFGCDFPDPERGCPGQSDARSEIAPVVNVRLSLVAQSEIQSKVSPRLPVVAQENSDIELASGNQGISRVYGELRCTAAELPDLRSGEPESLE